MTENAPRTASGRALAERALSALLRQAREHADLLVVIGGLVPVTLPGAAEVAPHHGTNDVDVLLELAPRYDRDDQSFAWLERALASAGFIADSDPGGWRWTSQVDGRWVLLEFLVDVPDVRDQVVSLPGAKRLRALSIAGPAAALQNPQAVMLTDGIRANFAGLGGYVIAKAAAVVGRGLRKDLYDFGHVVLGATRDARVDLVEEVERSLPSVVDYDPRGLVLHACDEFASADAAGPRLFARESRRAGAVEPEALLARDAITAVRRLAVGLRSLPEDRDRDAVI